MYRDFRRGNKVRGSVDSGMKAYKSQILYLPPTTGTGSPKGLMNVNEVAPEHLSDINRVAPKGLSYQADVRESAFCT